MLTWAGAAVVAEAGAVAAVLLGASLPSCSSRTNTLRMTRISTAYTRKVPASMNASTYDASKAAAAPSLTCQHTLTYTECSGQRIECTIGGCSTTAQCMHGSCTISHIGSQMIRRSSSWDTVRL